MSDYIFNTMTGKPEKKERLTPEDCWGDGCDPEILTVGKFCRWCHAKKPYHSHCPIPAWAADRKEKAYLAEALTNVNNRLSMAQARIEALERAGEDVCQYAEAYTRCLLADMENDTPPEYPPDSGEAEAAIERWTALPKDTRTGVCGEEER